MDMNNLTKRQINNFSINDFIKFFQESDINECVKTNPNRLEYIFKILRKKLPTYKDFCNFIVNNVKPTFEFYMFTSLRQIFFARDKVPNFYFENIEETEYDVDYTSTEYDKFSLNIEDSIRFANQGFPEKRIVRIIQEYYLNVYASKLYFLEAGNGADIIERFNLRFNNFNPNEKERLAIESLMEIEESYEFMIPYYDDEKHKEYPKEEQDNVTKNYSNFIGTNEAILSKLIMGLLKINLQDYKQIINTLVSNYEKLSGKKYLFNISNLDRNQLYNDMIDYYVLKLINGELSHNEKKYLMIELINAHYEYEDLNKYIPLIESKITSAKDEYLLLLYQVLLSSDYANKHGFTIENYYYSTIMPEEGMYDENNNVIRFYLQEPESMIDPYIIYDGMETAYHETRHAHQYFILMHQMNLNSFLNNIERVLLMKPENKKEYKNRYESVYYERDARVASFYETYKKLREFNNEDIANYVKNRFKSEEDFMDLKLWKEDSGEEFLTNAKMQKTPETFKYLVDELYKRYSLEEIASMREEFPTFKEIINEDGTFNSIEYLKERADSCIMYDEFGYIIPESLCTRAFLLNFINMYQRCISDETNNLQSR